MLYEVITGTLTVLDREGGFSRGDQDVLSMLASQATIAVANAHLYEQTKELDRLKSEFVATMSHELRSPLNIIIGYHELLLDGGFGALTAQQREPLRRADRSARELLELVITSYSIHYTKLYDGPDRDR